MQSESGRNFRPANIQQTVINNSSVSSEPQFELTGTINLASDQVTASNINRRNNNLNLNANVNHQNAMQGAVPHFQNINQPNPAPHSRRHGEESIPQVTSMTTINSSSSHDQNATTTQIQYRLDNQYHRLMPGRLQYDVELLQNIMQRAETNWDEGHHQVEERKIMLTNPNLRRPTDNLMVEERKVNFRREPSSRYNNQRSNDIYIERETPSSTSSDVDEPTQTQDWNESQSRAPASGVGDSHQMVSRDQRMESRQLNQRYGGGGLVNARAQDFYVDEYSETHSAHHYPNQHINIRPPISQYDVEDSSLRDLDDTGNLVNREIQQQRGRFIVTNDRYQESFNAELSLGNYGAINVQSGLNFEGLDLRQQNANLHHHSPPIAINNSSSGENGAAEDMDYQSQMRGIANAMTFEMGGFSLGMPMGLPDNQMSFLNPNNRAMEQYNSTGVQSSKTTSRNSSIQREQNNASVTQYNIQNEDNFTDDEEEDSHQNERRIFIQRGLSGIADAFRYRDTNSGIGVQFDDVVVDEVDQVRPSARENSIGRSLNMRNLNQRRQELQQPNLRPRISPFNQARISQQDGGYRLNDSEEGESRDLESTEVHNSLNPLGINQRRARFLLLNRPHQRGLGLDNQDGDDEVSDRSYNFIGEEEATFMDQIINRANNFRNFDDYEALLNLDENIVQSVPQRIIDNLPIANFTEGNRANFSEDNLACTICMCQFELEEEYMICPCLHRFHTECIKEWFNRRNTCPNCKDRILDHFEAACPNDMEGAMDPCQDSMAQSRGGASIGNFQAFNIAQNSIMRHHNDHNFVLEEEKSDDDEDLYNRQRQILNVQGQFIQRFEPRSNFIINRSSRLYNPPGINPDDNDSVNNRAIYIAALPQTQSRHRNTLEDSLEPSLLQTQDNPMQHITTNQMILRFRGESDRRVQLPAIGHARPAQDSSQIMRRQQQHMIDFNVGSASSDQSQDEPEEEESSLR